MTKVKVIDSIMGSGKTEYAIKLMNESDSNQKFIYITPFLNEVKRVKESVSNRKFHEPQSQYGEGSKYKHFKKLIASGVNIVTTHSLFGMADDELLELLQYDKYTLIIDEVMDVVNLIELKKSDIQTLKDSKLIEIDNDDNLITWTGPEDYEGRFQDIKDYSINGNLFFIRKSMLAWNFPAKIFSSFEEVYLMTYIFDGQLQKYYYDLHRVDYEYYTVHNKELIPYTNIYENRGKLKQLINIYNGKLNDIGDKDFSLSSSWFDKNKESGKVKELKNNLYNYFRNVLKAKADYFLWTTFKERKTSLRGEGFSKSYIVWNIRATNDYKERNMLAFCLNRYLNPIELGFFQDHDIKVDIDLLALTDMLQWIFRSSIRQGEPINIYIPSARMRNLLVDYLDCKI
jgi:hypothetical protein